MIGVDRVDDRVKESQVTTGFQENAHRVMPNLRL